MDSQSVLIPVRFPDPDPLPPTFIEGLTSCKVILLGVDEVDPDVDEEERHRREIEAYDALYSLASSFVRRGETAEVELALGEDQGDAPAAVAEERGVDALLIPNPITTLGRVLIPIRDEKFAEPVADFVGQMNEENLIHTTLFHVAESEGDVDAGEELLAAVRDTLIDAGFPATGIDTEVVVDTDPSFAIGQAAEGYDLIVMGETQAASDEPSQRIFGKNYESIAERTEHPIIVVRED